MTALLILMTAVSQIPDRPSMCSKWGLILPMIAVRYEEFENLTPVASSLEVKGPFQTFGAGRNFALGCEEEEGRRWAVTFSTFAFTQGLDFKGDLQLGVGFSLGLMVEGLITFGVGAGYDLIRVHHVGDETRLNGLFSLQGLGGRSISYFIVFELTMPR